MVVAVGGMYMHPVPDVLVRASCPFGGGICERHELCGVLSGGVMVLGALWGRSAAGVNDDLVKELACEFRSRFLDVFGTSTCGPIRDSDWRSEEMGCAKVVRVGAAILIEMIERTREHNPVMAQEVAQ